MDDWFKKPNKPSTPDRTWNDGNYINSRPPQKWFSNISKARQPPHTFDELMSTPIDFSTYVMHNMKIDNLTQEIMVGPSFNLLKGAYKSFMELEYHFKECYKDVTDQLDWNNPEGHEYPFDLSKPLPLIKAQVTYVKVMKWYDYSSLEEIIVRREDQTLHKFKEGNFSKLNLRDIEDLLLLLVQKKLSNLEKYVIFDLNVALRMFTRRIVILKTLTSVRNVLHDVTNNQRMEYLPQRKWSNLDRKRSKSENKGKVPTEMKLVLEQTKQDVSVEHKAPNTSLYIRKKDSKGKKPRAKSGHRKQPTSSKHHPLSKIQATKAQPSFLNVARLTEVLVKSLKPKFLKILSTHDFSSSLPTELKELSNKFNNLTKEVKGLKKHVHELEIELPRDLKDIPDKLETFT
nr:hypothetical protein [Tanacetum cinerariifolium]